MGFAMRKTVYFISLFLLSLFFMLGCSEDRGGGKSEIDFDQKDEDLPDSFEKTQEECLDNDIRTQNGERDNFSDSETQFEEEDRENNLDNDTFVETGKDGSYDKDEYTKEDEVFDVDLLEETDSDAIFVDHDLTYKDEDLLTLDIENEKEDVDTYESGLTRYPSGRKHSPITKNIADKLRAIIAKGVGENNVFMQVGDSISSGEANLIYKKIVR